VGLIYTDREFAGTFGRVGAVDARFKAGENWVFTAQAAQSANSFLDGSYLAGPAFQLYGSYRGRKLITETFYSDRGSGWNSSRVGFFTRPDIRRVSQFFYYRWRPEKTLIAWGPNLFFENAYDHSGLRLDIFSFNDMRWEFQRQTGFGLLANYLRERLRPKDFGTLPAPVDFEHRDLGFFFWSSAFQKVTWSGLWKDQTLINFVPPPGGQPYLGKGSYGELFLTVTPFSQLRIDNSYINTRMRTRDTNDNIFNIHILRSKWNYQFNRELSFRVIAQYDSVLANNAYTDLPNGKHANVDFLVTYLINPGTALYLGYNSNLRAPNELDPLGSPRKYFNDGRIIFAKVSWLFRY